MFITFEGPNGSGKSTQVKLCVAWLKEYQSSIGDIVQTREPGGSPGAEDIRALLLTGDVERWSRETELLLHNAARRDHVEKTIRPALQAGQIVISDRYVDSTRVLQTLGDVSGDRRHRIDMLHQEMIGLDPDLTIVLDVDLKVALDRLGYRGDAQVDRMEAIPGMLAHEHVTYHELIEQFPDRIVRVSGEGTETDVAARVRQVIAEKLQLPS